jgi:hypothetical protein
MSTGYDNFVAICHRVVKAYAPAGGESTEGAGESQIS